VFLSARFASFGPCRPARGWGRPACGVRPRPCIGGRIWPWWWCAATSIRVWPRWKPARPDALILAAAGLNRLGLGALVKEWLDPLAAPPAPGQGALAIQTRAADAAAPWLVPLRHRPTTLAVAAERGALAALEGSCRTAMGAHATVAGDRVHLVVEALTPDGAQRFRREGAADVADEEGARELGQLMGLEIAAEGGARLMVG